MKNYRFKSIVITIALLITFIACAKKSDPSKVPPSKNNETAVSKNLPDTHIVVYYFLTNQRCRSCIYLENTTKASLDQNFADELKKGNIVFKAVNIDEPQNKHFIDEYGLFTKSVIVSSMEKGVQKKWKNLDKIWDLIGQDDVFKAYITSELRTFIKS
ncbi:MAG: hypothetical protein JNL74_13190 [Fibrobacteres bacterium]|nr:hypothetical protein [Fibrobacterota bacterium]